MVRPPPKPRAPSTPLELAIAIKKARLSFLGFCELMRPEWTFAPFQVELIEALDKLIKRELFNSEGVLITGILVNMPPRYAKSDICTRLLPAYFIGQDARRHVMSSNFNSILARDFGRDVREIVRSKLFAMVFPEFRMRAGSRSAEAWKTEKGGSYFSVGQGATTSGRPANLLIWDDPIKSRKDAASILLRNDAWAFYQASLEMRLQPEIGGEPPIRVVVMTRWHPDDPAARIMKSPSWARGEWLHLCYPAIIDEEKEIVLFPERYSFESLVHRRAENPIEFAALQQQQPYIAGGELVRSEWWRWYPEALAPKEYLMVVVTADTATKTKDTSDFTVFQAWGCSAEGDLFLLDQERRKIPFPDQKRALTVFASKWRGRGLRGVYIEDQQTGSALLDEMRRDSGGLPILSWRSFKDKVQRVNLILPMIEAGRCFLPNDAPWIEAFVEEVESFPNGTYDDQVDAMSMAIDILTRQAVPSATATMLGESLLEQYNRSREIVMGKAKTPNKNGASLNSMRGNRFEWKGWGG